MMHRLPLEDPVIAAKFVAAGRPARRSLPLEDPRIAAAFVAAKQEAPPVRRARATWGPHAQGLPLVYAPRWRSDHHAWVVDGTQTTGAIRYAGHEIEEVSA